MIEKIIELITELIKLFGKNPSSDKFQKLISHKDFKYCKKIGITKFYFRKDNDLRSTEKKQILENSNYIFLLARSGRSYLNPDFLSNTQRTNINAVFWEILKQQFMDKNREIHFRILLNIPYSIESLYLVLDNFERSNDEKTIIDQLKLTNIYKFFKYPLDGYNQLKSLCNPISKSIELRISDGNMPATVLLGDTKCFYEPYLYSRIQQGVFGLTFMEMQILNISNINCKNISFNIDCKVCNEDQKNECSNSLYKIVYDHCARSWDLSMSLEEYLQKEDKFQNRFVSDYFNVINNNKII